MNAPAHLSHFLRQLEARAQVEHRAGKLQHRIDLAIEAAKHAADRVHWLTRVQHVPGDVSDYLQHAADAEARLAAVEQQLKGMQ